MWQPVSNIPTTTGLANKFLHLHSRRQTALCKLHFLLNCRKNHVFPKFINIKLQFPTSYRIRSTIPRLRLILLRAIIRDVRSNIAHIEDELYDLHLFLAKNLNVFEWEHLYQQATFFTEKTKVSNNKTHLHKLRNIIKNNNVTTTNPTQTNPVVNTKSTSDTTTQTANPSYKNYSNLIINEHHVSLFNKGLKFAPTPHMNNNNIISSVEGGMARLDFLNKKSQFTHSKLKPEQKDFIRSRINNILTSNIPNKAISHNLSHMEINTLKEIKSNPNILITKADKGGQTVILNKTDYTNAVEEHLTKGPYSNLKLDPLPKTINGLNKILKTITSIPEETIKSLKPSHNNNARFYMLPKIHKPTLMFRPIVSTIGFPTHTLSKFLAKKFAPLRSANKYSISNSTDFVKIITTRPTTNLIMVSFDIISLYTNVPITDALHALYIRLIEFNFSYHETDELIRLTEFCLRNSSFSADNKFYIQTEGLAMGNSLSSILSDIFLHYLESKIIKNSPTLFELYLRYVDDTFALLDSNTNVSTLLDYMNSHNEHIQFTYEIESNSQLPFLDVLVTKNSTNFSTQVYRKSFSISLPPHHLSAQPLSQKICAFYTFVNRAINISSNETNLTKELTHLKLIANSRNLNPIIIDKAVRKFQKPKTNSTLTPAFDKDKPSVTLPFYPKLSVKIANTLRPVFNVAYKPVKTINNFLPPLKDPIPIKNRYGIYKINCECNLSYIGQTRRSLHTRISEHITNVTHKHTDKSNIAKHALSKNHKFDFNNPEIIITPPSIFELNFRESSNIVKNRKNLINDNHIPPISPIWNPSLNK